MDLLHRTCSYNRMILERVLARGFVILGGAFWMAAAVGAALGFLHATPIQTVGMAMVPFAIAAIAFVLGLFYERLAAVMLLTGAVVVVGWGLLASWEAGVWMTMTAVLIFEMVVAGLLFLLAARTERVCELQASRTS